MQIYLENIYVNMKLGQLSNMDLARLAIFLFEACNKANSEEEEKKKDSR